MEDDKPTVFPALDRDGEPLCQGDIVRIVGLPDLTGYEHEEEMGTRYVFQRVFRTYRRIVAFDEIGNVEIRLRIFRGIHTGSHYLWIEPYLLKKRKQRVAHPTADR